MVHSKIIFYLPQDGCRHRYQCHLAGEAVERKLLNASLVQKLRLGLARSSRSLSILTNMVPDASLGYNTIYLKGNST